MEGSFRRTVRLCIPSCLTIGALVSGLSAVKCAAEQKMWGSVTCILVACVLDGLDGHTARYLNACTKIGFELDSLCDCGNFGVVPALVVYFWASALPKDECTGGDCGTMDTLVWIACCCYSACCALRLARFNVEGKAAEMDKSYPPTDGPQSPRPPVPKTLLHNFLQKKLYFRGVPAPVGAAYALTPMMMHMSHLRLGLGRYSSFVLSLYFGRAGTAVTMLVTGLLMVCSLPTFSSKMLKMEKDDTHLRSRNPLSFLAKVCGACLFIFCLVRSPFDVILTMNLLHLGSIPLSVAMFAKCSQERRKGD